MNGTVDDMRAPSLLMLEFTTQTGLEVSGTSCVQDVVRESQGKELWGIKRNHIGFYGLHLLAIAVLLLSQSFLLEVIQGRP